MSFTALDRLVVAAFFACASVDVLAEEPQTVLSCATQASERTTLTLAPQGARRVSKHVLEVTSKRGPRRFIDKPPHEDMSGIHWRYCGYAAQPKAHLIEMVDEGRRSGDLLLEDSGKRLRAGYTVLFSPNGKTYLAIEQEAGMDGETWTIRDTAGKTTWTGYAGTLTKVDGVEMVVSTFAQPRWTRDSQLTAHIVCASSKDGGMTQLIPSPSGRWQWQGHGKC